MQNTITLIFCGLFSFAFLFSCNKDSSISSKDLSSLSGTWNATIKSIQVGTCASTNDQSFTTQKWTVENNGNITIVETETVGTVSASRTWTGTVSTDYEIDVSAENSVTCFGSLRTFTMYLKDKIQSNNKLIATVDFPICPPNCIFKLQYTITKQ